MSGFTDPTTHTARRKIHRCSWCDERIVIGEIYKRYRSFDCRDVYTNKMHQECYDDMQDQTSENGGWIEFSPGDFKRPKKKEV